MATGASAVSTEPGWVRELIMGPDVPRWREKLIRSKVMRQCDVPAHLKRTDKHATETKSKILQSVCFFYFYYVLSLQFNRSCGSSTGFLQCGNATKPHRQIFAWLTGDTAVNASKILSTKQWHDIYSKDSQMERTPRCSAKAQAVGQRSGQQSLVTACSFFFFIYFHFGRVWCELAKRESRDWWIPNCVLGRQQMLYHRC